MKCDVCEKKNAIVKVFATVTICSVSGVLQNKEDMTPVYVCDDENCQAKAAKAVKKVTKAAMADLDRETLQKIG